MKLTIVFLAVAVALAAGQNYYFHFSNAKSEANRVAGGFYGPVEVDISFYYYYYYVFHLDVLVEKVPFQQSPAALDWRFLFIKKKTMP